MHQAQAASERGMFEDGPDPKKAKGAPGANTSTHLQNIEKGLSKFEKTYPFIDITKLKKEIALAVAADRRKDSNHADVLKNYRIKLQTLFRGIAIWIGKSGDVTAIAFFRKHGWNIPVVDKKTFDPDETTKRIPLTPSEIQRKATASNV